MRKPVKTEAIKMIGERTMHLTNDELATILTSLDCVADLGCGETEWNATDSATEKVKAELTRRGIDPQTVYDCKYFPEDRKEMHNLPPRE